MSTVIPAKNRRKAAVRLRPMVPDFCPSCDAVDDPFVVKTAPQEQEYRNETFTVEAPGHECSHCGFRVLGPGDLEALCKATSDAYRLKHDLLTSADIVERRKAMRMSQGQFAGFLGVGTASVKRWESGVLVQDEGHDRLMRLKTDHLLFTKQIAFSMRVGETKGHAAHVFHVFQPEPLHGAMAGFHMVTSMSYDGTVPTKLEMLVNSNELALAA